MAHPPNFEMIVVAFDLIQSTYVLIHLGTTLIEMFPCSNLQQYTTSSKEIVSPDAGYHWTQDFGEDHKNQSKFVWIVEDAYNH